MKIFKHQPVRKAPRVYDGLVMPGHAGLITSVSDSTAQLVIHNLYKIEVIELPLDMVTGLLYPEFEPIDPKRAAGGILVLRNFMAAEPQALQILENIVDVAELTPLTEFKKHLIEDGTMAADFVPCTDFNRRTCIQISRVNSVVKFIPLRVDEGLDLSAMDEKEFDSRFKPIENYPAVRACLLYKEYAVTIGATPEALDVLRSVVSITSKEYLMATSKKAANAKTKADTAATTKLPRKVPAVKQPVEKKATASHKTSVSQEAETPKRETPANLFQELIMAGTMTDDQIFAKVKIKFGLDDKKRAYVSWYRNYLTKHGKNPPPALVPAA